MLQVLTEVAARWRRYEATTISRQIAEHDAMFQFHGGTIDAYLHVGRSASETIALAMVAARKTNIGRVLDLPCGAGRVTRHLRALFPDADLFISDVDKPGEAFTAKHFRAIPIETPPNFGIAPDRSFDLIFSGSLLTHLPEQHFLRAFDWFCAALAPDAILVLTLHGRRADYLEQNHNRYIDSSKWQDVRKAALASGFGFIEMEQVCGLPFGFSLTAPSWIMRIAEARPSLRIIGYHEAAWNDHQDVLILQNKPIDCPYR